jgi:NADP-dependent 3-hydroxy acid dehydrogenase YdfG
MTSRLKLAVISGASKGLGNEISPLIESNGFRVIKLGLNSPGDVDYRCDLASKEKTLACIEDIRQKNFIKLSNSFNKITQTFLI